MAVRIGINGFGRMGRLALREGWGAPELEFVHVNEIAGGPEAAAHLLNFDSVHGRWGREARAGADHIEVDGTRVTLSSSADPAAIPWRAHGVDVVLECTGKLKTAAQIRPHFPAGARKVVVAAPVKDDALNIVMGVNDDLYDPETHDLVTAASCTTNCLAPVVKVIHEAFGIRHGVITTLHDLTNTQVVVDKPHNRICGLNC